MSTVSSSDGYASALISYTTSGTTHQSPCSSSRKDYDFIDFLGVAQSLKLDFLPFTWQPGLDTVGEGRTAEIHQALISVRLTFAFKHMKRPQSVIEETLNLQALVAEISVLGHPVIQRHPNIASLAGICWDVVSGGEKVWPVPVFDKTNCGDMAKFMTEVSGKQLDFRDRLDLLYDVGLAVRTLHAYGVIHGDIKPWNVLIYSETDGRYRAKVIDFGYSSLFMREGDTITMPNSGLWTAPEQHHRQVLPMQARKMDAYSFGMLCLWLFFYNKRENQDRNFKRDLEDSQKEPLSWAYELLDAETELSDRGRNDIRNVFRLTLAQDSAERTAEFTELLQLLSSNRALNLTHLTEEISIPQGEYQLIPSSYQLIRAHYGVRGYIVKCLRERNERRSISQSQALDLALCYELGFGVKRDVAKCKTLLKENNISMKTLKDLIKRLKGNPDHSTFQKSSLRRLFKDGYLPIFDFGRQYHEEQRLHEAESHYQNEMKTLGSSLGHSHPLVQQVRLQLCLLMRSEGRRTDAEKLQLEMIKLDQRIALESPLPGVFATFLADLYGHQGELKEAERLQIHLMERDMRRLGVAHPLTLVSMANLASTYSKQGQWKKAEELQVQVVEMERKAPLNKELPQTLENMSALASTYRNQRRWKEAEDLGKEVIEMKRKALGIDHPTVLADMANLAKIYIDQGRWQEAESLERQGMEISKKVLGVQNANTVNFMANLALVYNKQERWEEAQHLRIQVVEARKRVLGPEHPDTLSGMNDLAWVYNKQERWEESKQLRTQILETRKKTLDPEHPDTLSAMANLAMTYALQGHNSEAEHLRARVLDSRTKVLGAEHPATLTSMASLASTYVLQKRWDEAERLEVRVLEARKRSLGNDHPDTKTSIALLASRREAREAYRKAEVARQLMETGRDEGQGASTLG